MHPGCVCLIQAVLGWYWTILLADVCPILLPNIGIITKCGTFPFAIFWWTFSGILSRATRKGIGLLDVAELCEISDSCKSWI